VILTAAAALFTAGLLVYSHIQANDFEESSRRQLRAYISVLTPRLGEEGVLANPLTVAIILKNSGQTPAFNIAETSAVRIIRKEEMQSIANPDTLRVNKSYQGILGPGIEFSMWRKPDTPPFSHAGLSPTDYRLFVYGKFEYDDIFGTHHWTTFCYHYQWWIGEFYPEPNKNNADKND
jgi:hypothetical protein